MPRMAAADIRRCPNSIMVSSPALAGKMRSEHAGQLSPHPSPDPVARTIAPAENHENREDQHRPRQVAEPCPHLVHGARVLWDPWTMIASSARCCAFTASHIPGHSSIICLPT